MMMKLSNLFPILLILLSSSLTSLVQTNITDSIHLLMTEAFDSGKFNGNALVVLNGKEIYARSHGFRDASGSIPLTMDYRFNIGSIYKEFSAVAIMQLKEQGKLSLEDPIANYIPDLPSWSKTIRIRHLLQYTSGLPNLNWSTIKSDQDILTDLKQLKKLKFEPGTAYFYNNNDIAVRQLIVENISGMRFNSYVEEKLFSTCGMSASVVNPDYETENIAIAFSNEQKQDKIENRFTGVIYVTARDLLKWEDCLCNKNIITRASLMELGQSFNDNQSGLGIAVFNNGQWLEHQHNGESRNFEAILYSNFSNHYTIILLGNNKNRHLFELTEGIINLIDRRLGK